MFKVFPNKGFQITFENGWTVSVMFGAGNYCQNRDDKYWDRNMVAEATYSSKNAEVAAWDKNDNWFDFGGDQVNGYCKPDYVAGFIQRVKDFD